MTSDEGTEPCCSMAVKLQNTITELQIQHSKGLYTPLHETERRYLKAENERLRAALENIIKHQEFVAGSASPYSTVLKIAKEALAPKEGK